MLRCSLPTDVGLPSWEVPFTLAFNTERYQLADLLTDPDSLDINGFGFEEGENGEMIFRVLGDMDSIVVQPEDLTLDDHESITMVTTIDTIVVPMDETVDENYGLDDMLTAMGLPTNYNDGDPLPLPPGGGSWEVTGDVLTGISFDALDSVRVVHVVDGEMSISLENDTGIDFSSLIVEIMRSDIHNPDDYVQFATFDFGSVVPGEEATETHSMTDDLLTSQIQIRFNAMGDEQVFIANHADALYFTMGLDTLKADFAEAIIGPKEPQTKYEIIYLDDDFWVKEAIVDFGYINYTVTNETDVYNNVTLRFANIFRQGSEQPYDTTFVMDRSRPDDSPTVVSGAIDIAGMLVRYDALPTVAGTNQEFLVETTITIIGSDTVEVTEPDLPDTSLFQVGQAVTSDFELSDMALLSANGVPRNIVYEVEEQSVEVTSFEDQEQLQEDLTNAILLQQVSLVIDFENNVEAPIRMELDIEASNQVAGTSADTSISHDLDPHQQQLVIDDISNLVNIVPDMFTISGVVSSGYEVFGVPEEGYQLSQGDYVLPSYSLAAPMILVIPEDVQLRPDIQAFEETISAGIAQLRLLTVVENWIPTGGWLYLMGGQFDSENQARRKLSLDDMDEFGNSETFDEYGLIFDFDGVNAVPLYLQAPQLDQNGRPTAAFMDTLINLIPEDRIDLFSKKRVYTRQVLVLESRGDTTIVVNVEDYLDVSVIGEVSIQINDD